MQASESFFGARSHALQALRLYEGELQEMKLELVHLVQKYSMTKMGALMGLKMCLPAVARRSRLGYSEQFKSLVAAAVLEFQQEHTLPLLTAIDQVSKALNIKRILVYRWVKGAARTHQRML